VEEVDSKKQTRVSGAIVMLLLVCTGLICVAGIQYFRGMKSPPLQTVQTAQKEAPQVVAKESVWHLRLRDIPERKIFIGFKYADRVYMDVSELCNQAGFRMHADDEGLVQVNDPSGTGLVLETPDITLPGGLGHEIWWVVSSDELPEGRVFDAPYQWLSDAHAPPHGACLFLGQRTRGKVPRKLNTAYAEPVIGLIGREDVADIRLRAHEGAIEVTKDNRVGKLKTLPWLLSWLHKFSSEGAEHCGSSDGFMPTSRLLPIKVKITPTSQQNAHWLAATGCKVLDRWSLVMTNEDGTASFIPVQMQPDTDGYSPTKVWTVDIDDDGLPEFLFKAQYYEGSRHVLLRLNKNDQGDYYLTEIAGTSYEGF
jgi:hypothetical protein